MVNKFQGDDIKVTIQVLDDNGNYMNIDDMLEIYVFVFHKKTGNILEQFSKAGAGDYTSLIKVSTTEYYGWIDSSITENAKTGIYKIGINNAETETDLTDNIQNTNGEDDLFVMHKSVSKIAS